ncbi:MAG: histone deacetylase family protein [Candidatus Sericytochromatia bacterium]
MSNTREKMPVFFHPEQLAFKPLYEWAFGKKIKHPETTKRAESILSALKKDRDHFDIRVPELVSPKTLRETHSYQLMTLYNTTQSLEDGVTFYPSVFPNKKHASCDPTNILHAGYFCFDSGTPLNAQTLSAASWSASCAYDAASLVADGTVRLAYALSRPPGHHASENSYGGYCYFNNAAIACEKLLSKGRVAILDIDFHHGNGTQELFYETNKVLTLSIHGDPRTCYPYYSGFSHEMGVGKGEGYNLNFPLPKGTDFGPYRELLEKHVLPALHNFVPDYLIIAAGFDTYRLDPVGDFNLETADYFELGRLLAGLGYPTVVIQEGGYYTPDLGLNVATFLKGMRA